MVHLFWREFGSDRSSNDSSHRRGDDPLAPNDIDVSRERQAGRL